MSTYAPIVDGDRLRKVVSMYFHDTAPLPLPGVREEVVALHGPIEQWDVSRVTDFQYAFADDAAAAALELEDLSAWDVSAATSFEGMFLHCSKYRGIGLGAWGAAATAPRALRTTAHMFRGCAALAGDGLGLWRNLMHTVRVARGMFAGCKALTGRNVEDGTSASSASASSRDLDLWGAFGVASLEDTSTMFGGCISFTGGPACLRSWGEGLRALRCARAMFAGCVSFTGGDDFCGDWSPHLCALDDASYMFAGCVSFTGGVSGMERWLCEYGIADASYMFGNCRAFVGGSTALAAWGSLALRRATNIRGLFAGCVSLQLLDARGWAVSLAAAQASGRLLAADYMLHDCPAASTDPRTADWIALFPTSVL